MVHTDFVLLSMAPHGITATIPCRYMITQVEATDVDVFTNLHDSMEMAFCEWPAPIK